jgi:hypothetical protein
VNWNQNLSLDFITQRANEIYKADFQFTFWHNFP